MQLLHATLPCSFSSAGYYYLLNQCTSAKQNFISRRLVGPPQIQERHRVVSS
jgi:hypothetical protein